MTILRCGDFAIDLHAPRVMGIVNVTPDSFSDGGACRDPVDAIDRVHRLVEEGAAFVDIGAESTRPAAVPIDDDEEWRRLEPVLSGLRDLAIPVSVDTRHPRTMEQALDAGASMINDVSGFTSDAARAAVRGSRCGLCVMHMRGIPATMQVEPVYDDVVSEVAAFLRTQDDTLVAEGVDARRIVVDPGFGFGKTFTHNLALLRDLDRFAGWGRPVLVGLSRKGMIGTLTGRPVADREAGSLAAALVAVERGARIVRTHDVAGTADALKVWSAAQRPDGSSTATKPVIASGPLASGTMR